MLLSTMADDHLVSFEADESSPDKMTNKRCSTFPSHFFPNPHHETIDLHSQ